MPDANILVIAVDGLRASALGAYGNTTYSTPALDRFAAESFLFDQCFANASRLDWIYRALWSSAHPGRNFAAPQARADAPPLPHWLTESRYASTLVTDDPAIAALPAAKRFAECVTVDNANVTRADDVSATGVARLFATASEHVQPPGGERGGTRLVWVHSRGMYGPWDAPLELQEPLVEQEEGDPSPCDAIEPPDFVLDAKSDPDAIFRFGCGYAAQVMVLDACLEGLLELIDETPARDEWLIVLCGARGFPLGEHGRIGGVDERLFVEQVHVPMLWRFSDGTGQLARSRELASSLDLLPTLLDWIEFEPKPNPSEFDGSNLLPLIRQQTWPRTQRVAAFSTPGYRTLRTAEWCLHHEPAGAGEEERCALYVRPDDRWEANDVANLCPHVVEELRGMLFG